MSELTGEVRRSCMEKKDEYGIYLGIMPGKYPKSVQYCRVNDVMGHFGIYLLYFPEIDPKSGVKFGTQGTGEKSHIWGILNS